MNIFLFHSVLVVSFPSVGVFTGLFDSFRLISSSLLIYLSWLDFFWYPWMPISSLFCVYFSYFNKFFCSLIVCYPVLFVRAAFTTLVRSSLPIFSPVLEISFFSLQDLIWILLIVNLLEFASSNLICLEVCFWEILSIYVCPPWTAVGCGRCYFECVLTCVVLFAIDV